MYGGKANYIAKQAEKGLLEFALSAGHELKATQH